MGALMAPPFFHLVHKYKHFGLGESPLMKLHEYQSLIQRHKWLNIPLLRGAITLIEVMILGIKHLNYSADVAMKDAEEQGRNGHQDKQVHETVSKPTGTHAHPPTAILRNRTATSSRLYLKGP